MATIPQARSANFQIRLSFKDMPLLEALCALAAKTAKQRAPGARIGDGGGAAGTQDLHWRTYYIDFMKKNKEFGLNFLIRFYYLPLQITTAPGCVLRADRQGLALAAQEVRCHAFDLIIKNHAFSSSTHVFSLNLPLSPGSPASTPGSGPTPSGRSRRAPSGGPSLRRSGRTSRARRRRGREEERSAEDNATYTDFSQE